MTAPPAATEGSVRCAPVIFSSGQKTYIAGDSGLVEWREDSYLQLKREFSFEEPARFSIFAASESNGQVNIYTEMGQDEAREKFIEIVAAYRRSVDEKAAGEDVFTATTFTDPTVCARTVVSDNGDMP